MSYWEVISQLPRLHKVASLWFGQGLGLIAGNAISPEAMEQGNVDQLMNGGQAFVLRASDVLSKWEKAVSLPGTAFSLTMADSKNFFALVKASSSTQKPSTQLIHSSDGGKTWNVIGAPLSEPKQVSFYSNKDGYLWLRDGLARTQDGGLTWKSPSGPHPISTSPVVPVFTADGKVWYIAQEGLVCLAPDGTLKVQPIVDQELIEHLSVGPQGEIWVSLRRGGSGATRLTQLWSGPDGSHMSLRGQFQGVLATSLHVNARTVLLVGADLTHERPQSLVVVRDKTGTGWSVERDVKSSTLMAPFLADDGTFWAVGTMDRLLRRHP